MQREILGPLGMKSTVPDIAGQVEPGSAHFYYPHVMLNPRHGLQDAPTVTAILRDTSGDRQSP